MHNYRVRERGLFESRRCKFYHIWCYINVSILSQQWTVRYDGRRGKKCYSRKSTAEVVANSEIVKVLELRQILLGLIRKLEWNFKSVKSFIIHRFQRETLY